MTVIETLRYKIGPELNHIYTTPPFEAHFGSDLGWYCREHALHTFFVATLFGSNADIRRGDFAVTPPPPFQGVTSLKTDCDHAWCSINNKVPVDLSMTFKYFGPGPQLASPISGTGMNGVYRVYYSTGEAPEVLPFGAVCFFEREIINLSPNDLLLNPHLFLFSSTSDDASSWDRIFGPDIFARISLHCFRVATGHAKPIRNLYNPGDAARWIFDNYPNAVGEIKNLLPK